MPLWVVVVVFFLLLLFFQGNNKCRLQITFTSDSNPVFSVCVESVRPRACRRSQIEVLWLRVLESVHPSGSLVSTRASKSSNRGYKLHLVVETASSFVGLCRAAFILACILVFILVSPLILIDTHRFVARWIMSGRKREKRHDSEWHLDPIAIPGMFYNSFWHVTKII